MSFLKGFLTSCLGAMTAMLLVLFGIIALVSMSGGDEIVVRDDSVLTLELNVPIIETEKENPFSGLTIFGVDSPKPIGLAQLKQSIKHAKSDSKIEGIYLSMSYPMTGFTVLEEIRESLIDFRESGKWVIAYSDVLSEGAYYLASAADKVFLNPEGEVEFNGLAVEINFFKRLFDKLDIKPEVFRVGEFKSAVEPFLFEKMSEANRLQLSEMIDSIYDEILQSISESRAIPKPELKEISDKMIVRNAELAKQYGLVDSLLYKDQVEQEMRRRVGIKDDKRVEYVSYYKYKRSFSTYSRSDNEIAVVVAEGTILPGKANPGQDIIGSETFSKELRKVRDNKKVKAVVIRINSPGGSSLASDIMWREIALTSAKKPVIASMSDYAASGGYYLAMGCDTIVAHPHTITGSIGVFSVLYDASGFLNNKIGITSEELKTGEIGELVTINRPLRDSEKAIWQKRTEEIYETFTRKAAEGRGMTVESIKKIASGRVWTGIQAQERGLVDIIGSYEDAVKLAAEAAGVADDYKVRIYPQYTPSLIEQLLDQLDEEAQIRNEKAVLGSYYYLYQRWKNVKSYEGTQARLPFEMKIQ